MKKRAQVYARSDGWFFLSSSRTVTGLWLDTSPVIRTEIDVPAQTKGDAALKVLYASQIDVPERQDGDTTLADLLKMASVKSWQAFMNHAKAVRIGLENETLTFTPDKKPARPKGALEGLSHRAVVLSANASPAEVGAALLEAMNRCE